MPPFHSKYDKRVESVEVNDDPHERYQTVEPFTGEEIRGIPIPSSSKRGQVLRKNVTYRVSMCPDCSVPARYSKDEEPICPSCGMIMVGKGSIRDGSIVRDAKAAGRKGGTSKW